MTLTRSKRIACEPLLSLSSTKPAKKRKIANFVRNDLEDASIEPPHKCRPSCGAANSTCPFKEVVSDEESSPLNKSDHNENDIDISVELESINSDENDEIIELDDDLNVCDKAQDEPAVKSKRGKNLAYVFIEEFESKESLDAWWNDQEFDQI